MSVRVSGRPAGRVRRLTALATSRPAGVAALAAAAAYAGACVHIDTAPGGIAATRLAGVPPSIVIGDSLRDSVGAAIPVRGIAFDTKGAETATAGFRYTYIPAAPDTTTGATVDTALVVDSVTGAVRATRTWVKQTGRIFARIGSTIQLADTFQIVPRPTALVTGDTATVLLRYDCTDDRAGLVQRQASDSVTTLVNAAGPFALTVKGDSAGTLVGVRRWLVRWSIDTVTAANPTPTVTLASGAKVPAIAIATATDALIAYDTTALGSGTSSVLLRIRPTALDPAFNNDSLYTVTLRADVIRGAGQAVPGSPVRGVFRVRMQRNSHPVVPNVAHCPR